MGSKNTIQKPFIDHLHELQIRLTWAVLAIIACGIAAYSFHKPLLEIVQRPLGQTLYYTSPTGGFSFLFKLCFVFGFIAALPIVLYQLFKFLGPLLERSHKLEITAFTLWSMNLAYAGVLFAYFISLPAALQFLAKFGDGNIQALITADEYFNFALAYLGGFAALFQLPLIVLFINRIKPLSPRKMMGAQRYIILGSFIAAAILTPTPDPVNQAIMALPAVALYQLSIAMVLIINRVSRKKPAVQPMAVASPYKLPDPEPVFAPRPKLATYSYAALGSSAITETQNSHVPNLVATRRPMMTDVVLR